MLASPLCYGISTRHFLCTIFLFYSCIFYINNLVVYLVFCHLCFVVRWYIECIVFVSIRALFFPFCFLQPMFFLLLLFCITLCYYYVTNPSIVPGSITLMSQTHIITSTNPLLLRHSPWKGIH